MDAGIITRSAHTLKNIVNARIEFHIAGTVEERIAQLTSTTAPFSLVDEMHGLYRLRSKARISDQNFVYTNADNEQMLFYSELHGSTQEALGFSPGSDLTVNECRLDQINLAGFREIGDYLSSNSVPYYIFSVVKDKFDVLVGGHNPLNGTTLWQH